MGEYTGRAKYGVVLDLAWGGTFLFTTLIFVFVVGKFEGLLLVGTLVSVGITIALFSHLIFSLIPKKLVINDVGIFLYEGRRLIKKEYWNDVKKVVSYGTGGRYPRSGFIIYGRKKMDINANSTLGPEGTLKNAFREIVQIAKNMGISIEDHWGWASDIANKEENIVPEEYMGQWHRVKRDDKSWLLGTGVLAMVSILIMYLWVNILHLPYSYSVTLGGWTMAAVFIFLFLLGLYMSKFTPTMLYFDENSVRLRFLIGKEKEILWRQIKEVRCFEGTGIVTICLYGSTCYSGVFGDEICRAIKSIMHQ